MDNQDKIFDQIKQAADNAESREFPGLESVWSRVEDKLDNKALTTQNKKWKQWAVAASAVAVLSLGYQLLKPEPGPPASKTNQPIVYESDEAPQPEPKKPVSAADTSSILVGNADEILKRQIKAETAAQDRQHYLQMPEPMASARKDQPKIVAPSMTAVTENPIFKISRKAENSTSEVSRKAETDEDSDVFLKRTRANGVMSKGRVFDAKVVASEESGQKAKNSDAQAAKQKPLLIVDGSPVVARTEEEYDRKLSEAIGDLPTQRDTIFHLKEPLYIINGVEYSEESLFGPNPTSPYAPLNLQEEGMTTTVYTGKEALRRYGDKGKNGVVVIKTKNGQPALKRNTSTRREGDR